MKHFSNTFFRYEIDSGICQSVWIEKQTFLSLRKKRILGKNKVQESDILVFKTFNKNTTEHELKERFSNAY